MAEQALASLTRPPAARAVRRIQPSRGLVPVDLGEVWRYRELLYRLVWRDIKARYKQTVLGPAWAILRPLVGMVVMAAVFGGLAGFTSGSDVPYPLFLYAGLLVWTYFAAAFSGATSSVLNNASLLGKVYFPRLYAPLAAVSAPLVDFALALSVVFGLFAYYGRSPTWHVVFLPFLVLLALLAGLGVGLWLSGLAVRYRDIPFMLPFVLQIWFYVTPVLYPVERLPEPFRTLMALNPMTSVVEGFRWALLGDEAPEAIVLAASTALALALVASGLFVFRRTERTIVDLA